MSDRDDIVLPSGTALYANFGIVGISADLRLGGGMDHNLEGADLRSIVDANYMDPEDYPHISTKDKVDLANRMIDLWEKYRLSAKVESTKLHLGSLNPRQRAVLDRLFQDHADEQYSPLDNIAIDLQLTKNAVRLIVRALARKGLAERVPFHDDEGYIRGSGYGISELGRRLITENAAPKTNV